ncbi:multiple epidermal growth factor-like domains protein 8 [Anneissia japonica]|uniref:multiple epidermal growth factor-like domains protein 8 n=1 Tax=Anneissia japonica TaxID=1529436 RepID=UPI001425B9B6|nr:multiple epidermal growth factor-like domains protein 8 [Anneissia japonica]
MGLFLLSDIQVNHGMFDIFIASNEYLLMVVTNKTSGVQMIHINDSVRINSNEVEIKTRRSTKVMHLKSDSSFDRAYYNTSIADKKRAVDNNALTKSAVYKTEDVFKFYETTADGVNNFLYITFSRFAVKINDVRDRLVVHFQHKRQTNPKYFIAFVSKGDGEFQSTMALIKLSKLSKAHIDLFVFFSVFFSSFFILLSLCVLIWKIKLWRDNRLRFRRQTMEMESRRSRPFGVVFVMIDQKRTRHQRKSRHGHRNRGEAQQMPTHPNKQPPSFITLEPTFDDLATVCTVLMTLPGGDLAPSRGCLGSSLFSYRPPPPKIQDSRQKNAEEIKPRLATYYSRMRQGAVARGRTHGQPPPPPEWL